MRKLKNVELNRISIEEFKESKKTPVVIVLDNIRSQNNTGSVFRTADAFLLEAIFLCGITATPPHREIHKTALGATDSVEWKYFDETSEAVKLLKEQNFKIFAVEQALESISLNDFYPSVNDKIALIFGNEVKGIEDKVMNMVDACIEIPQFGTKHSLNISISAGIVIWEVFRKINKLI
ncbi:MAG: RNA methyltransferase [Bacteroidales bacterium]|nr:RNA methyltransferase [Bacteroidales bacterium]